LLHIAGNFHDLGKLAVPVEVLEKNGPLDANELFIMRSHSFHTYRVLDKIGGLDDINAWSALHHECLDGSGYPFRYTEKELPLGSRIVAVADVFSALTESRSYRHSLQSRDALKIIWKMGKENKLDRNVVSLVDRHFKDLMGVKATANDEALKEFHAIKGGEEAIPGHDRR
jgi:HD-GYP domain-containing protein (c-di-GMP phosphodiesterase class II)